MSTPVDVATALGPSLLDIIYAPENVAEVRDVFLPEPADTVHAQPGDLVLGVAVAGQDEAVRLVDASAGAGASGVIVRAGAAVESVAGAARRGAITLIAVGDGVPWAHMVWLLRGVIDRPPSAGSIAADAPLGTYNDLFALADTVAAIVGAPVTFEDPRSRVLAYSSGQGETDMARVATIVGRRVPENITAQFRARGVFRRMARSDEPFLVPAREDGTRPRFVVPVRAGGQLLGSIWAVVDRPVDEPTAEEVRRAASVLALHLLRMRAHADIARRDATELIRSALWQYAPERVVQQALPGAGPWRVVALHAPDSHGPDEHLQVWETVLWRHGWPRAPLADVDGTVFSILTADDDFAGAGTWAWLVRLVREIDKADGRGWVAAAGTAASVASLPRSRVEAAELLALVRSRKVNGPTITAERAWDAVTLHRAGGAVDPTVPGNPLQRLIEHDAEHETSYVATLGAWLDHHGQPMRAAEALTIHPNTLRYRMQRLRRLMADVDLDDPRQRLALRLQIEAVDTGGDQSRVPTSQMR